MSDIPDLDERIRLLRAASRPTEPLSDRDGPTAQGHILSALSKLERTRAMAQPDAICSSCGNNREWHREHRPRHLFIVKETHDDPR